MKKTLIITTFFILLASGQASSQNLYRLSAAFNTGATILIGDNDLNASSLGINAKIGPHLAIARPLSLNLMFGVGNMNGSRQISNFKIQKMNYKSGELALSLNLLSFLKDSSIEFRLNAGAGLIGYNVIATQFNTDVIISNYNKIRDLYYTAGISFGFKINDHLTATLDLSDQRNSSDMLDGVAHGEPNDWFAVANLGIKYRFSDISQKSDNKTKSSTYNSRSYKIKTKCPRRRSKFYYYIKNRTVINRWDLLN